MKGMEVRFGGRTLLVETTTVAARLATREECNVFAAMIRKACAGPQLRMAIVQLAVHPIGVRADCYVNTDEPITDIASRIKMALIGMPHAAWIDLDTDGDNTIIAGNELSKEEAATFWQKAIALIAKDLRQRP